MWFSNKRKAAPGEQSFKNFFVKFSLGVFFGIFVLIFYINDSFQRLELLTLDLRFKLRSPHKTSDKIAIIEISDDSIEMLGRWPWPRQYHAALVNILNQYEAKSIGFDIIFSESTDAADDDIFSSALKESNNVYLPFSYNKFNNKYDFSSKIIPLEKFIQSAKDTTFINIDPDPDGKIRYADLFVEEGDSLKFNFSLKLALDFLGVSSQQVKIQDDYIKITLKNNEFILIPLDKNKKMLINWPGKWTQTFKHYSFFDILNSYRIQDEEGLSFLDSDKFKDKICLVGVTATGLGDIKSVPIEPLYHGVGVHACILNSILNRDFIYKTSDKLNIIIIFIFSLILPFFVPKVKVLRGILIVTLFTIAWWYLVFFLFEKHNIWINFIYPTFTIIVGYGIATIYNEVFLTREKARLFKVSTIDGLTGLHNKTYFTFLLQTEFSSMRLEDRKNLALIMADIDHFKSINDTFGHQIGDFILKGVAGILQENSRPQDIIGRFGGEEFIIMLKNTDLGAAYQIAQRIRKGVEICEFKNNQDVYRITISLGVATFQAKDTIETLIKRADSALYQAKNDGRNRVCQEILS